MGCNFSTPTEELELDVVSSAKANALEAKNSRGYGQNYDYLLKLLIIGDSGVGKSCLLLRFCDDAFTPSFISTVGIDFKVRTIELDGKRIKLQLWDTAGQERFRTISTVYYRGAMGVQLVYDVTDPKSFEHVNMWMNNIAQHAAPGVTTALVANKCDATDLRQISTEEGRAKASQLGLPYKEVSAKTGEGVEEAYLSLAESVKQRVIDFLPEGEANGMTQSGQSSVPNTAPANG